MKSILQPDTYIQHSNTTLKQTEDRRVSGIHPNIFTPNFYNPHEIKRRRRTSREQATLLEKTFIENPKPSGKARHKLAEVLSMSPRGVQVWFQNKRAKVKQQQKAKTTREESLSKNLSSCNMTHTLSQSSSSDSVPCSAVYGNNQINFFSMMPLPSQEWFDDPFDNRSDLELSPVQSQVQLDTQFLPLSCSHQTFSQIQIAYSHESRIQPYLKNYLDTYLDNALAYHQNVDDWADAVSLFHNLKEHHMIRRDDKVLLSCNQSHELYWPNQQIKHS